MNFGSGTKNRRWSRILPAMLAGTLAGAILISPAVSHVTSRVGHLKTAHLNPVYFERTAAVTSEAGYTFAGGAEQAIPDAAVQVTVPPSAGNRRIIATFNTESRCDGPVTGRCVLRIFIGGIEGEPSDDDTIFSSDGEWWQSRTIVRSRVVTPGTYSVFVQGGKDADLDFRIDNWHLLVEVAKP